MLGAEGEEERGRGIALLNPVTPAKAGASSGEGLADCSR
jgi:hypothetical protein